MAASRASALALLALAASCGSGADDDAPVAPDASSAAVVEVSCSSVTPDETVSTGSGEYVPSALTIAVGGVVELAPTIGHTATSLDHLFEADQGETRCFRFQIAGEYPFYCAIHGFQGVITVQ